MQDIISLRQFYASPLGRQVKRWLRRKVKQHISRTHGETLVGLGYATPLLRGIETLENAPNHIIAVMPGAQGAIYWPVQSDNRVALGTPERLPFADSSVHWIVMLHAFEFAESPADMLREAHRVLVPGGRLLLFVPHRHRPWRWWGETPFKEGTSYRYGEMKQLMHDAEFTITDCGGALMLPPFYASFLDRVIGFFERVLSVLIPRAGSVMCVEVEKQIYAAMKQKKRGLRIGMQPIAATAVPNARDISN